MSPLDTEPEGVSQTEDDVEREEIIALVSCNSKTWSSEMKEKTEKIMVCLFQQEREFHWLLKNEVHQVLHELTVVLKVSSLG